MSSDHQAVSRGHQARRELELTERAFEQLKAGAVAEWLRTSSDQAAKREKLWMVASTLDSVREALRHMVDSGLIAEAAIEAQEAQARAALAHADLLRP
jgi:hypothetical protein